MKYFAKLLPVSGEIKREDLWISQDGLIHKADNDIPCQARVAMYLCSADVIVGDRVHSFLGHPENWMKTDYEVAGCNLTENFIYIAEPGWTNPQLIRSSHRHWLFGKLIGLISPGAVWVKEGDEFEDEDISMRNGRFLYYCEPGHVIDSYSYKPSDDNKYIRLRCPSCRTFH